jgi:RNA polymerase sigma factor (sigma-70 family)
MELDNSDLARLTRKIRGAVAAMRVPRCAIDDWAQETFVALLESDTTPDNLGAYAVGIARHLVLRELMRRVDVQLDPTFNIASNAADPLRLALVREKAAIVNAVVRALPREQRELITRFYFRGQSQRQICADLKITATRFRLEKSRAKAVLTDRVRRVLA